MAVYHGKEASPNPANDVTVTITGKPAQETPDFGVNVLTEIQTSYYSFEDTTGDLGGNNYGQWYSTSTKGDDFCFSVQTNDSLNGALEIDGQVLRVLPREGMIGMQTVGPSNASRPENTTFTPDQYEEGADYFVTMDVYIPSSSQGFLNDLTITCEASGGMAGASATAPTATMESAHVTERDQWVTISSTQFTKPTNIFKASTFVKLFYPATTSDEIFYLDNMQFKKITEVSEQPEVSEEIEDTTASGDDTHLQGIAFVLEQNLFEGDTSGEFFPMNTMTHAMTWCVLYRMSGDTVADDDSTWYTQAQNWANSQGFSEITSPDKGLSLTELKEMLTKMYGADGKEVLELSSTGAHLTRGEVATILMDYLTP